MNRRPGCCAACSRSDTSATRRDSAVRWRHVPRGSRADMVSVARIAMVHCAARLLGRRGARRSARSRALYSGLVDCRSPGPSSTGACHADPAESRPPLPPFCTNPRCARRVWPKMHGTRVTRSEWCWPIRSTTTRATAKSSVGRAHIQASLDQMGTRARLSPDQGTGTRWGPHRRALCLRMARHGRPVVPLAWQRKLGVRFFGLMQRR